MSTIEREHGVMVMYDEISVRGPVVRFGLLAVGEGEEAYALANILEAGQLLAQAARPLTLSLVLCPPRAHSTSVFWRMPTQAIRARTAPRGSTICSPLSPATGTCRC